MKKEAETQFPSFCLEIEELSSNSNISYEFLNIFEYDFCLCEDEESGKKRYEIYFKNKRLALKAQNTLSILPQEWLESGVLLGNSKIICVEQKDWAEEWKKYFPIQHITDKLTVKPAWLEYTQATPDEAVVVIDPGMSFGTGGHATTRFCLKMLAKIPNREKLAVLDAGCGSGILSAAAYKLQYESVTAFDYDPICIKCSRENFAMNNIPKNAIKIFNSDITKLKANELGVYDVAVVNILSHIIKKSANTITSFVQKEGYLILSGILTTEYPQLKEIFTLAGFKEIDTVTESEWTSGLFERS